MDKNEYVDVVPDHLKLTSGPVFPWQRMVVWSMATYRCLILATNMGLGVDNIYGDLLLVLYVVEGELQIPKQKKSIYKMITNRHCRNDSIVHQRISW